MSFEGLLGGLILGGLGFAAAFVLGVASRVFYVYVDPRVELVEDELAGANCGGCGYPGCHAAANAVVAGEAKNRATKLASAPTEQVLFGTGCVRGFQTLSDRAEQGSQDPDQHGPVHRPELDNDGVASTFGRWHFR